MARSACRSASEPPTTGSGASASRPVCAGAMVNGSRHLPRRRDQRCGLGRRRPIGPNRSHKGSGQIHSDSPPVMEPAFIWTLAVPKPLIRSYWRCEDSGFRAVIQPDFSAFIAPIIWTIAVIWFFIIYQIDTLTMSAHARSLVGAWIAHGLLKRSGRRFGPTPTPLAQAQESSGMPATGQVSLQQLTSLAQADLAGKCQNRTSAERQLPCVRPN